jgi:four helix bundle protein
LSKNGDFARDFGLRDQMRRTAVSIMSNIAEGFESHTRCMFIEYLGRARGSCAELRSQTYVACDASYVTDDEFDQIMQLAEKCGRHIYRCMQHLKHTDRHST